MQSVRKISQEHEKATADLRGYVVPVSSLDVDSRVRDLLDVGLASPVRDSQGHIFVLVGHKHRAIDSNQETEPTGAVTPITIDFLR